LRQEILKRIAWLSPVRRLPAETLSKIFVFICEETWDAPLILGAVCSQWRSILLSTPRAW
ncbi:hypothetical protein M408DRAFT_34889, partial [Serendipita vermifera MAFF 305830]